MISLKHLFFTIIVIASSQAGAQTPSLRTILDNRKALRAMHDQKPEEALQKLTQALARTPDSAALHLNMGLVFEMLGQPDKALQSYQTAEKFAQDGTTMFAARFNQGVLHQKAKKVDEALKAYHSALDVMPDSRETKINIELLIQSQQGGGQGEGDKKQDQKNDKDKKNQKGKGQDQKDDQDKKDGQDQKDKPKEYAKEKPQPRQFKSDQLDQGDVKKILGEIRNQEQKIRSEYNKREVKEQPRDKDW